MDEKFKSWIDSASYEELLRKWRFASLGDPIFSDQETAEYYQASLMKRREIIGEEAHSQVSKLVGWDLKENTRGA